MASPRLAREPMLTSACMTTATPSAAHGYGVVNCGSGACQCCPGDCSSRCRWQVCLRLSHPRTFFPRVHLIWRPDMKLPVQAPAVVRGSVSWPTRRPSGGSTVPAIEPAGTVVRCSGNTPNSCVCKNGVATCCSAGENSCTMNTTTGACNCTMGGQITCAPRRITLRPGPSASGGASRSLVRAMGRSNPRDRATSRCRAGDL